jgi:hypothetical protein
MAIDTPTFVATTTPAPGATTEQAGDNGSAVELETAYHSPLAEGATNRHTFLGNENTPLLITISRTDGDLLYDYEILGPRGDWRDR